jgi:uncharacterized membrane protein YdcZ (DUF606 family)
MTLLIVLIAIAAGLANHLQSGTNAEFNKQLASPLWARIVVYVVRWSHKWPRIAGYCMMVAGLRIVAKT